MGSLTPLLSREVREVVETFGDMANVVPMLEESLKHQDDLTSAMWLLRPDGVGTVPELVSRLRYSYKL